MDYDTFLAKLGARDRLNLERHLALCQADPRHAQVWQRLISQVAELAPLPAQTIGQQAVMFFMMVDGDLKKAVVS